MQVIFLFFGMPLVRLDREEEFEGDLDREGFRILLFQVMADGFVTG